MISSIDIADKGEREDSPYITTIHRSPKTKHCFPYNRFVSIYWGGNYRIFALYNIPKKAVVPCPNSNKKREVAEKDPLVGKNLENSP